jgi:hypothetical protein
VGEGHSAFLAVLAVIVIVKLALGTDKHKQLKAVSSDFLDGLPTGNSILTLSQSFPKDISILLFPEKSPTIPPRVYPLPPNPQSVTLSRHSVRVLEHIASSRTNGCLIVGSQSVPLNGGFIFIKDS